LIIAHPPSWLIGLILAVVLPLLVEFGYRCQDIFLRNREAKGAVGGEGHLISAILGLLGLMIGFTYAMASERYDARRELVVAEANALSTTWLRAQLFDAPERERLSIVLKDYARERMAFPEAGTDKAKLDAHRRRTLDLEARFWTEIRSAIRTPIGETLTESMLESTNQMFDLADARRAALDAHVPEAVMWALTVFACATAGIIGYGLRSDSRRHLIASTGLCLLVALAIAQIVDLDEPREGAVQIQQSPMIRVVQDMVG
jgi:hypothetical protein